MPRKSAARVSKVETKSSAADEVGLSATERILAEVNNLYDGKDGIEQFSNDLGMQLLRPRKKVTVMIMGNHSAGKSSFINWYVDEHVQAAGVAVESQGFTIIKRGKKREPAPIKGPGVLQMYPHLSGLGDKFGKGVIENLAAIVSISDARMFPLVDFIDTPGLVDGNVEYPFDVNGVIEDLAEHADLILVFLDPIGQALCSRTMSVVAALNESHYEKMRYFLTKADTVANPEDLVKVICQITQNLCEHIHNTHGFNIPAIFIPTDGSNEKNMNHKLNAVGKLCQGIETTIHQKVQDNLNTVKDHCDAIRERIASIEQEEKDASAKRSSRMRLSYLFFFLGLLVPLGLALLTANAFQEYIPEGVAQQPHFQKAWGAVQPILSKVSAAAPGDRSEQAKYLGGVAGVFLLLQLLSKFFASRAYKFNTRSSAQMRRISHIKKKVPTVLTQQKGLYKEFLKDSVGHQD